MSNRTFNSNASYGRTVRNRKDNRKNARPNNFVTSGTPPSYAYQDQQKGVIDDITVGTESLRLEQKNITKDKDEDIVDSKDFKPAKETGRSIPSQKSTTDETIRPAELKSAFAKSWTIVNHLSIPAHTFDDKSWYVPNCITLFETLHHMEGLLSENEELRWVSPNYFSLPVRIYYSVLFYVQVLRAKMQAGKILKTEGSWLRSFNRRFVDTSLPIAGPLVPIFANLVACLPDDDQYDFCFPTVPAAGSYHITDDGTTRALIITGNHFLLPCTQILADIFSQYILAANLDNLEDTLGQFVPWTAATGGNLGGIAITGGSTTASHVGFLANPVIMNALPESIERLKEIKSFWARSRLRRIPIIDPTNRVAYTQRGPAQWTLLDEELDWFESCIEMATIQAKFFTESTNLSEIPTVGGMHSLVKCDLQFTHKAAVPTALTWYGEYYRSMTSTFSSSASELQLDDQFAAMYALTNAEIQWTHGGNKVGSHYNAVNIYRVGPYWSNNKVNFQLEHQCVIATGIRSMLHTQFYKAHGDEE